MSSNISFYIVETEESHSFIVNADSDKEALSLVEERGFTPLSIDEKVVLQHEAVNVENLFF